MSQSKIISVIVVLTLAVVSVIFYERPSPSDKFPGFTQVGKEGETSKFYIALNSANKEHEYMFFKLLRIVDGGYTIQDVTTNCHGIFQGLEGVQYKADGTSDKKYPADTDATSYYQNPVINAVVTLACDKAAAAEQITGAFNDTKALELLYGQYHSEAKAALWTPPAAIKGQEPFNGNDALVSVALSQEFMEGGVIKHLLVTSAVPNNQEAYDCHACSPLIGAAIFSRHDDKWNIDSKYQSLAQEGGWGKPSDLKWLEIGKDRHAILVSSEYTVDGITSSFKGLYELNNNSGWTPLVEMNGDAEEVNLSIKKPESGDVPYNNILITRKSSVGKAVTQTLYHYQDDQYVDDDNNPAYQDAETAEINKMPDILIAPTFTIPMDILVCADKSSLKEIAEKVNLAWLTLQYKTRHADDARLTKEQLNWLETRPQKCGWTPFSMDESEGKRITTCLIGLYQKRFEDLQSRIQATDKKHGWMGIRIGTVTYAIAESLGLKQTAGVFVMEIVKSGPADKANIIPGDIILRSDGKEISSVQDFSSLIANTPSGKIMMLELWHKGEKKTAKVVIEKLKR